MLRKVLQSLDDLQRKSQKKNRSQVEEYASINGVDTLFHLWILEAVCFICERSHGCFEIRILIT